MKIIARDNFARENIDEKLIAENVPQMYAEQIIRLLNEEVKDFDLFYFYMVEDDYKLFKFEP